MLGLLQPMATAKMINKILRTITLSLLALNISVAADSNIKSLTLKSPFDNLSKKECEKCNEAASGENKEYCAYCKLSSRQRSLPYLFEEIIPKMLDRSLSQSKPVLAFAPDSEERERLANIFPRITSVSLYGVYGDEDSKAEIKTIEGVDLKDLSRFSNNSFSTHYSFWSSA